jgi:hypothetical protein
MIRVFAIVAVLGAFGAALYLSGNYLQAWEAPEPPATAAPAPDSKKKAKAKPKAKPARLARKAKKAARRKALWLTQLNALCIRILDDSYAMEPPSAPEDVPRYVRRFEAWNARRNRQAIELVQRSGDAKTTKAVRGLFDQEEQLVHRFLTAAQNGDGQGFRRYMRSLLALGKEQNRLFARLGAVDCTLPPDAFDPETFDLYY